MYDKFINTENNIVGKEAFLRGGVCLSQPRAVKHDKSGTASKWKRIFNETTIWAEWF